MAFRSAWLVLGLVLAGCSDRQSSEHQKKGEARAQLARKYMSGGELYAELERLKELRANLLLSEADLELLRELEELRALYEPDADGAPATVTAGTPDAFTFGFQSRDHQLFLHTGTDPQLYTVKTKDGQALAEGIDDARLERDYPQLHGIVHEGVDFLGIGY